MALREFLEYHFEGSEAKLRVFLEEPVDDQPAPEETRTMALAISTAECQQED